MLSMKVYNIKKEYSFTRFLKEDSLKKNMILFDKLNVFGRLKNVEILKYEADAKYRVISLTKYNLVLIVLNLPYRTDVVNIKLSKCNKCIKNSVLRINSYLVIRSNSNYLVHMSCKAGSDVRRSLTFLDDPDENFTLLACYYYRDDLCNCITPYNDRFILIGSYVRKWYINNKKIKILTGTVDRIQKNTVTKEYYLDSDNTNITSKTDIMEKDYNITVSLMFTTMESIKYKRDLCLLQALRWPLGKPSLTFFKLWYISVGVHDYNRNIKYIERLIQRITGKRVSKDFQLGDALVATFGIVRRQANKLGIKCNKISFNNLWKDISLIQIARYNKFINRKKEKQIQNKRKLQDQEYIHTIINPWMIDISKEIELCEELKLNILDKVKWSYDWPSLKTNDNN
ncbi:SWPV1-075 [Shearwaterpox virus]|uniref:SWPV1-075 n=1 Tax=Shearwaterpox virus TaxID=1974596 RepID=A0A1V0S7S7_CNPV|nr:SWPV1-075 [Shearwaterpox virus]